MRCVLAALALFATAPTPAESLTEDQVKAGFIFNFARMVAWPITRHGSPLPLCIAGDDPAAAVRMLDGKDVDGRRIEVRTRGPNADLASCDIVYVPAARADAAAGIAGTIGRRPILTIGDGAELAGRGLVISLYRAEQGVRFAVNVDALRRSGLNISSRLLNLAQLVHDGESP